MAQEIALLGQDFSDPNRLSKIDEHKLHMSESKSILLDAHNRILYGNPRSEPSIYESLSRAKLNSLLFDSFQCLRTGSGVIGDIFQVAECGDETKSYYHIARGGLHQLIMYLCEQASLFVLESPDNLRPDHPTMLFFADVIPNDVASGLQSSSDLFLADMYTASAFSTTNDVMKIVLFLILMIIAKKHVFDTYIRNISKETYRAAVMLAYLEETETKHT